MWKHKAPSAPELVHCSFCGKSQNQVKKLLAGPDVYICDECIGLAVEALEEEGLPLGSADPDRHVYVQIPVPALRTSVPTDALVGELLYIVGVDSEGKTDTVPVRLLRREPADDAARVLLQLRCVKESAITIAGLIATSRPFTILRLLGQPESDGLFARVTKAPPLPTASVLTRPEVPSTEVPWPEDPWSEAAAAAAAPGDPSSADASSVDETPPEEASPERPSPEGASAEEASAELARPEESSDERAAASHPNGSAA